MFLVVVFDGLRRSHVTAGTMPNLARFVAAGFDVTNSRSVFPSATRVNASAFSTGTVPARNGLVANKFFDPGIFADRVVDTSDRAHLDAGTRAYGGSFLTATTLGEALAQAGRRLGVWSCASPGTTFLLHPRAAEFGHYRLCLRDDETGGSPELAAAIERFGPVPPAGRPNTARVDYVARILLAEIEASRLPDVSVVWFNDPDLTYHYKGIGSPEAMEALAGVDRAFGEICAAVAASPYAERLQIVAMSDHGQIVARRRIDVAAALARAGLRYGDGLGPDIDVAGGLGSSGALRVRDRDPRLVARLAAVLREQDWCGPVFTAGSGGIEGAAPGTLDLSLLLTAHPRMPDLYYVMRADEDAVVDGIEGATDFISDVPEGGGIHGGLARQEMNSLLALGGSLFLPARRSALPGGIIDVAPTMLSLLGIPRPDTMFGRPLVEAIPGRESEAPELRTSAARVEQDGRHMTLRRWHVGRTTYLDGVSVG